MSLSIEEKIEIKKEEINGVSIVELEEAIIRAKCDLLAEIVGGEVFTEIDKKGMSINNRYEALRDSAKEVNPNDVDVIDEWDLTQEQKDYLLIQRVINSALSGKGGTVSSEDIARLQQIKAEFENDDSKDAQESSLRTEIRKMVKSSTIHVILEAFQRRQASREQGEKNIKEQGISR